MLSLLNLNIFQRALLQTPVIYSLYSGLQCLVLNNETFFYLLILFPNTSIVNYLHIIYWRY